MGVEGYNLLKICNDKRVIGVMLTAYAVTPEDIKKSYEDGAASFVPKEEMHNITGFLTDIYEAKEQGKISGIAGLTAWRIIVNANSGLIGKKSTDSRSGKPNLPNSISLLPQAK